MSALLWALLKILDPKPIATPLPIYELQDVISLPNVPASRIYDAARGWALESFRNLKFEIDDHAAAGTLLVRGREKFASLDSSGSCALWLRYRVIVGARDGRYYYSVSVLNLDADPICPKYAFSIPTADLLGVKEPPPGIAFYLHRSEDSPAARLNDERVEARARALAETVSTSLRVRLSDLARRSRS